LSQLLLKVGLTVTSCSFTSRV